MACADFEELAGFLISSGLAPDGVCGCSNTEIDAIRESHQSKVLLPEYIAFLEIMGKSAGSFLKGSDVFFPECLGNYEIAIGLLEEVP